MVPPVDRLTADGYDLQFGTNVLGASFRIQGILPHPFRKGHYYFTKLLLPTMIATAKATSEGKARIVNTSSSGHLFGRLDFDTLKDSPERRKRDSGTLYTQSKFVRPKAYALVLHPRFNADTSTGQRGNGARARTAVR